MKQRIARPRESARERLAAEIPTAAPTDTAAEVGRSLRGRHYEAVGGVYVIDSHKRLLGFIEAFDLLAAEPSASARDLMRPVAFVAREDMDQEELAGLAVRHGLISVPVVDGSQRLVGAVTPRALNQILRHEHIEDLHRLAGILRENARAYLAMEAPPLRRARDRLPWLLVGFAGSCLATYAVSRFEGILASQLAIAYFIPAIVYLSDAIGTQTEAIVVRGLSLDRAPLRHLLFGELRTGLIIGGVLASLSYGLILFFYDDPKLALSVAVSVALAGAAATSIGLLLPWGLARTGRDPALGSGPLATVIQDIASIVVYLFVARLLYGA